MKLSPAISCYSVYQNYPISWLRECITHIKYQDPAPDYEYIFVMYGKKNLTEVLDILNDINSELPVRFYYKPKIKNFIEAIQYAVSRCNGKYVLRADVEDRLNFWALRDMFKIIEKDDSVKMLMPSYDEIDNNGDRGNRDVDPKLRNISSNCLIERKTFMEVEFHPDQTCRDGYAIMKHIRLAGMKYEYTDHNLFNYRVHPGSLTNNTRSAKRIAENEKLVDQIYGKKI